MEHNRGSWGSNTGFLLAAIGSAVGLGNIWSFPYKMGRCGGFLFFILYLLLSVFVGFVIIFSRKADLTTKGFLRTLPLFTFFCLAAEVLNSILHRFSAANLFYISPWEMSTQLLFGDIDRTLGRPVGILLYILAMIAGAWLIHNTARKITDVVSTSAPHQHAPH